ncbi:hypothetical protein [Burkholderia contaminans]|jgi:S-ribosylhomocysteine lyase LuxS involved in autoinducer biosynthesis|uniref:hypothetical protein n=1 Tax=Burkholderia TaxID=32008 RepID=UPI001CF3637A|nr:hypothetical protein [Burkholderia contaminans]
MNAINAALPSAIISPGLELEVAVCFAIESECEQIIRNHITGNHESVDFGMFGCDCSDRLQ